MSETLGADIELIQQTATAIIGGRELNLASNRQVADLLIDELGAPKTRKTPARWIRSGRPVGSTNGCTRSPTRC